MIDNNTYRWAGATVVVGALVLGWMLLPKSPEGELPVVSLPETVLDETATPEPAVRVEANSLRDSSEGPDAEWTVVPLSGAIEDQPFSVTSADLKLTEKPMGFQPTMEGQGARMKPGSPDVPRLTHPVDGVPGMVARAEVVSTSYRDLPGVDLQPVEEPYRWFDIDGSTEMRVRQEADEEVYGTDGFWPEDIVSVSEAWMGTQKVARIDVMPVQYNPVTKTLRYHESVSARIRYEPKPAADDSLSVLFASGAVEEPDPFGCPALYPDPILPPMNGNASDFAWRRSGLAEGVDAIYKLRINNGTGIYLLTQAEMIAAGVPAADIVGSQLRIFSQDEEIAARASKTGLFTAGGDYIMFYAQAHFGQHTQESVYWLGTGGTGLRMVEESSPAIGGATEVTSHYKTEFYGPNLLYTDNRAPLNEDWDHWYITELLTIGGEPAYTLQVGYGVDFPVPGRTAKVCAALQGLAQGSNLTDDGHNTVIRVNGVPQGSLRWSGLSRFAGSPFNGSVEFNSSNLTAPTTEVDLRQELLGNNLVDQVSLEAVSLVYPRQLRTIGDELAFLGEAGSRNYTVDGFSSSSGLWAFDLTDPDRPVRITGFTTQTTGNGRSARFGRNSPTVPTYHLLRSTQFKSVTAVEKTAFRDLGNPDQQADYIVICPYYFRDQAYSLVTNRHLKGETVVVAPIEDVFNEFSYGYRDANAVRQFLGYAFHHWQSPPPRAVLIIGDASRDPVGYDPTSVVPDHVPTPLGGTSFTYTGLDVRNVLISGTTSQGEADNLADMALGRITVQTTAELQAVVDKIIAYEAVPFTDPFRNRSLLVAGKEDGPPLGFTATADGVGATMMAEGFTDVEKIYHDGTNTAVNVVNAINDAQGRYAAAYFGHGSQFIWNTPPLMDKPSVGNLVNGRLPIMTVTTCANGYYIYPGVDQESLAEGLMEVPSHGAVAVIAGTALSQDLAASSIAVHFYDALIQDRVQTLGEAMLAGYLGAFNSGFDTSHELVFYQIFGDPGLIVNPAP